MLFVYRNLGNPHEAKRFHGIGTAFIIAKDAATGMCGHRSFYPIGNLTQAKPVVPIRAFADTDCYNGIQVEAWPAIKPIP